MIDLILGALVFSAYMLAWWQQRVWHKPAPLVVNDEFLAFLAALTPLHQSFQRVGMASRQAAIAMRKFEEAWRANPGPPVG